MTFDFFGPPKGSKLIPWRYDVLTPRAPDFSSWDAVGHMGKNTVEFELVDNTPMTPPQPVI